LNEFLKKDDDDAYALTIAMRENSRARRRQHGPAYVLSNDLFRDAQQRDALQQRQYWHVNSGTTGGSTSLKEWLMHGDDPSLGPGRISYSFADMGRMDDHGDRQLDIIPNPRHPLVAWIEQQQQELQPQHSIA
jgi:hypothetical protein